MVKQPEVTSITTPSATKLNTNFESLRAGFSNTLSLDGSAPNAMNADFDLNSNDLINGNRVYTQELIVAGTSFTSTGISLPDEGTRTQYFDGDGATTDFTLAADPGGKNNTVVAIDGVTQFKETYTVTNTLLSFSEAPPDGSRVQVDSRYYGLGLPSSVSHTYDYGVVSAVERTVADRLKDTVSVKDFGAVGDGVTDDTSAFQAAAATRKNVFVPANHTYKLTDGVPYYDNQYFYSNGNGRSTLILIEDDFNMSASGVFYNTAALEGAGFLGLGFQFTQDAEAADRTEAVEYPPAVLMNDARRVTINNVYIEQAWDGIKATSNCGGAMIGFLEVGALNKGVNFEDGSFDFVHINNYHFYPFGFTGKTIYDTVYSDGSTCALDINRIDGLTIGSFVTFRGYMRIYGEAYGTANSLNLDGKGSNLIMSNGNLAVGSFNGGTSDPDDTIITTSGDANLLIGAATLKPNSNGGGTSTPFVLVTGASSLSMTNVNLFRGEKEQPIFRQEAGSMHLSNVFFNYGTNTVRTNPFIKVVAGRCSLNGIHWTDVGTSTGNAFEIDNDNWHFVNIGQTTGWTYSIPSTTNNGYYNINGNVSKSTLDYGSYLRFRDVGDTARDIMWVDASGNTRSRAATNNWAVFGTDGTSEVLRVDTSLDVSSRDHLPFTANTYDIGTNALYWRNYYGSVPGPYADDTAAGAAGIPVGNLYRVTGGNVAWRVS